jgi:alkylation response protein AidB-like acyl-CoA dehydrogenase
MAMRVLQHLREVEAAREELRYPSFMVGLFAGRPPFDLVSPFPIQPPEDRAIGDEFCSRLAGFLRQHVDPMEIDRTGKIPPEVLRGLAELGCFGMTIPKEYGGLGLSKTNYHRALQLVGGYCNVLALTLSAHQSIGVSAPILLFGNEAQKREWLPRIARGAISAFALTEPQVGSDPASMVASATLSDDGRYYVINGEKLWCTNGMIADVIVLMARVNGAITAFIVDMRTPGIELLHRCEFMGNRGIENAWMRFSNVRVPVENVIGEVGRGLKIALTTLNAGRVSLSALCLGMAKQLYEPAVRWAAVRRTFGKPIGEHELITHRLARMAADIFAMEAVTWLVSGLVDRWHADFRVEAAAAKLVTSERLWSIADTAMQIRGGRGYETAGSLRARGEDPIPIEQLMRDARLYLIGEGASEILTLFIAREVMDPHLRRARGFLSSNGLVKVGEGARLGRYYAPWYARQLFSRNGMARNGRAIAGVHDPHTLAHLRYVQETSRRLARALFRAMLRYQASLERRQALVARLAHIGVDLFVITASALYAPHVEGGKRLADQVIADAQGRIEAHFRGLQDNTDEATTQLGLEVLRGGYAWLTHGMLAHARPDRLGEVNLTRVGG